MKLRHLIAAVATAYLVSATAAHTNAAIIFSNLGPGDTFHVGAPVNGYMVQGPSSLWGHEQAIAVSFVTDSNTYRFTGAEMALGFPAGSASFELRVMADSGGLPGQVLQTIPFSGIPADPTLFAVQADGSLILEANTTYWMGAFAINDSMCGWNLNNLAATGGAFRLDTTVWEQETLAAGAMRISGTAVPEPASLAMFAIPALLLIRRRK